MLVLYKDDTTSFSNLGLGVLKDLRSDALITEELNGSLILEFEYIKKGHLSDSLVEGNLIKCNNQIFRIKNINKSLSDSESIKILAQQYFQFDMSKNFLADVAPAKLNGTNALKWIVDKAETKTNFVIGGDCTNVSSARYVRKNVSDAIYNADNSLLTRFGGELEFNLNNVYLKNKRGSYKGFSIRYRKNLKGLEFNLDFSTVATKICPQGSNELLLDDLYVSSPKINNYYQPFFKKVEFNDIGVDEETTEEQAKTLLKNAALELFDAGIDVPEISIKVDFVELSKCIEYKEYQNLETCSLGDTIKVIIPEFSINTSVRVVKTIYNDNLGRLTYLELGTVAKNIVSSNASSIKDIKNTIENPKSILDSAKKNATELINHPFKGNLYIDDKTGVLYLMDTNDISTAKNVWKWSMGGLGFSSNGINGTFNTAITQDGGIVADFITAGKINTDLIEGYSNLELAVQNSLLSMTPQYSIEGTDNWSDTIPTTETWQKILTRNKYVATNGKITYSKVIPYVEGMNNLINSIEGTNVSIYNSNDEEMGLESIVLEGRCMQETSTQGKNIVPTDFSEWESGEYFMVDGSKTAENARVRVKRLIEVKPTTTYYVKTSAYFSFVLREYDASGAFTRSIGGLESVKGTTFTTSENGYYIGISLYEGTSYADFAEKWADVKPFICLNSISDKEYADFAPNKPSPDYPSEVECVKAKNLLDYVSGIRPSTGGLTNTINEDGSITTTGKPTSNYINIINTSITNLLDDGELYTLSQSSPNNKLYAQIAAKKEDGTSTYFISSNGSVSITVDKSVYVSYAVSIQTTRLSTWGNDDLTINNKYMLVKGTYTADTSFVPYNNIQIRNVGKNYLPDVVDKTTKTLNGITLNFLNNNKILLSGTSTARTIFNLTLKESIKITKDIYVHLRNNAQNYQVAIAFLNDGTQFGWTSFGLTDKISNLSGITMDEFEINTLRFQVNAGQTINIKIQPSLEYTSNITEYKPYQSQTLNIDLQGNELCSIGDLKDELIIKNGRAKIIKRIGKVVLNGSEIGWSFESSSRWKFRIMINEIKPFTNLSSSTIIPDIISNYFTTSYWGNTNNNGAMTGMKDIPTTLSFANTDISTLTDFKTWLSTHNTTVYYPLAEEQEIDLGEVDIINLFTEDNNISNSESANMKIGYYTDYTFYKTVIEQYAKIDLNTDNINIELAKKTNSKDIIATINMSTEKDDEGSLIQINSDKLNIKNKVFNLKSDDIQITSPNFSLTTEGKITSKSGEIGGFKLTDTAFSTHVKDVYTYTQTDAARVLEIANGSTATEAEKKKYDVNEDGIIDRLDYTIILRKIYGYEATEGDFYIYSNDPRYMIKTSTNGTKTKPTKIGLTMMSTTEYVGCRANFANFDDSTSQTIIDGGQINCVALTQTSLEQHKKNIEKFSNALEEIKKTDIYRYNMKSESDDKKKHLGFVIGKSFNYSHLITAENGEGNEIGVDNYSMISLCLQAIKEQQIIIEDLETKINVLMKGINNGKHNIRTNSKRISLYRGFNWLCSVFKERNDKRSI